MTDPTIVPLRYKGVEVGIATVDGNTIVCEIHPDKSEFADGLNDLLRWDLIGSMSLSPNYNPSVPSDPKKG